MQIFSSCELRWFSPLRLKKIEELFYREGLTIPEAGRTDRYLKNNRNTFSLKIREGRIEIKLREASGSHIPGIGPPGLWTKWSYEMVDPGSLKFPSGDYIDVTKNRALLFTSKKSDRFLAEITIDAGCQIEYGVVALNNQQWFTFGLEAFARDQKLMQPELIHALDLLKPVMSDPGKADLQDYPELLASLS